MKRSEVLALIKEEVEVVLTNHEMIEFFDIDPTRLLDEMMNEQEDMKKFGQQRVTRGQQRRLRKQQAAQAGGGLEKEVTPQETGIIQSVENALSRIAADDDLRKYKVILKSLLTKLQKKGGGAEAEAPGEEMNEEEKMDIKGMDLKKGRCTPMGTPECPEGSPQYNLAKRFKSGDIHKDNLKKGKNPHGPG